MGAYDSSATVTLDCTTTTTSATTTTAGANDVAACITATSEPTTSEPTSEPSLEPTTTPSTNPSATPTATGSEIYASVYDGAGCSANLGSFKMTLDTCTQIPFSPINGYLYALTTLSGTDYSTTFSLESDCAATTGVTPNPVTAVIDTCTDLGIYITDSFVAHSEKFSNAYDSSATVTLDCTTTTTSATTTTAGANDVAACITATSEPTTSEPTTSEPTTSEPTATATADPTANGSEIYASVYDGAGCSANLGSFKMTLDTCTQIPFSPINGYLYAKTTLSGTDYSTTFSLESDCAATTGVTPNPVT